MTKRVRPDQLSDFGRKVEAWRRERKLTQGVLAELIGTSQRTYSGWIRKGGMPGGVYQIARLALLMDVPVTGLLENDAMLAEVRDLGYVERTLLRMASPEIVERYIRSRTEDADARARDGRPA